MSKVIKYLVAILVVIFLGGHTLSISSPGPRTVHIIHTEQVQRITPIDVVEQPVPVSPRDDPFTPDMGRPREEWTEPILQRTPPSGPLKNVISIIPVNGAFLDIGFNLWCSLTNISASSNVIFTAMESKSAALLGRLGLPYYTDPYILSLNLSSEFAPFGSNPKFQAATCAKPLAALRLIQRGWTVTVLDADMAFVRPPLELVVDDAAKGRLPATGWEGAWPADPAHHTVRTPSDDGDVGAVNAAMAVGGADAVFSWGGHLHPAAAGDATTPPCGAAIVPGMCYMNTGFYLVRPTDGASALMRQWLARCAREGTDDQTVLNDRYVTPIRKARHKALMGGDGKGSGTGGGAVSGTRNPTVPDQPWRLGCFDPCAWQNGNTAFKWRVATDGKSVGNLSAADVAGRRTLIHANFIRGVGSKVSSLQRGGLWHAKCVSSLQQKAKGGKS